MAERVGFEPTVGCPTHAFQACAFDRSAISPGAVGPRTPSIHLGRRRLGRRRAGGYRDSDRRDTRARSPGWGGRAAWLRHIFASVGRRLGRSIAGLRSGIGLCLGGETHSTRTVSAFGCPLVRLVEACHRLPHAPATHGVAPCPSVVDPQASLSPLLPDSSLRLPPPDAPGPPEFPRVASPRLRSRLCWPCR